MVCKKFSLLTSLVNVSIRLLPSKACYSKHTKSRLKQSFQRPNLLIQVKKKKLDPSLCGVGVEGLEGARNDISLLCCKPNNIN
jgi:hypothetical protein